MKKFFAFVIALLAFIVMSAPAQADPNYQSSTQVVWASGTGDCLRAQSEAQSNDINTFNWSVRGTAQSGGGDYNGCAIGGWEPPAGALATYVRLWRWDGSQWGVCTESGWSYSDQPTFQWALSYSGEYGPCGEGWYGLDTFAARYTGEWNVGGPVWSGDVHIYGSPYRTAMPALRPLSIPFDRISLP